MSWCRNMMGMNVSEKDMEGVNHPRLELYVHVTTKTVQAGTILGGMFIAPISRLVRGPRTIQAIQASALRGGLIGAGVGLALGPIMTYAKMKNGPEEGYFDRCYRLRLNRGQVRVDRTWFVGAVSGIGYALATGAAPGAFFVVGSTGGLMLATVYNMTFGGKK